MKRSYGVTVGIIILAVAVVSIGRSEGFAGSIKTAFEEGAYEKAPEVPTSETAPEGATDETSPEEGTFDHSFFGNILAKYVEDGKVDYKGLKAGPSLLYKYLTKVMALEPEVLNAMSRNEQLAFYINAYNALTLKVIVEHYPVRSIRDIPGVWDRLEFTLARRNMTLDHIEHQILRKQFKEPLVHFALVCASKSCATLRGEPYTGQNIHKVLEKQAYIFINDTTKNRLDKDRNTLYLSSYFKWFREDFGDVIAFVSKYFPEDDVKLIRSGKVRVKYLRYDWSLNEK